MTGSISVARPLLLALGIGAVGLVVGTFLAAAEGAFFGAFLMAFLIWMGVSLGALVFLAVNHMAGGSWGAVVRRPLEAMVAAVPLTALFFVPLLFGITSLYPWADPVYVATHPLVEFKVAYLNVPWFIIRALLYFAAWIAVAWFFLRNARAQDDDAARADATAYRMKATGGVAIVVYVITMTLATVDWGMSLTPEWWSGIYGVIFMISQAITALAVTILLMVWLASRDARVDELLTWKRLQDLGNFLMAFIMFWAYVNISQLTIQWSNNIVETNTFYVLRFDTEPWRGMGIYLAVAGFALPFLILFSRWVKRQRTALAVVAGWAILNQVIHTYWFIGPEVGRTTLPLVADVLIVLGLGGVWFAFVLRSLASRSLIPANDPRLRHAPVPPQTGHHHHAPAAGTLNEVRPHA